MMRPLVAALLLAGAGAAGCATAVAQGQPPARTTRPSDASRTTVVGSPNAADTPARTVHPRPAGVVVVSVHDAFPAAKKVASRVALALTTYGRGATATDVAGAVTADPARRRALAVALAPLVHPDTVSRGAVVYPQMGGATSDRTSVMVVVRQSLVSAGRARTETRTLDVRLRKLGSAWLFDRLASAGGTPVARPADLSPEAAAVVDDPRIVLPDTARWDIYRGAISPVLLRLMEQVAARTPYAVTVLETGHPYDVFGTDHVSMHSAGRAVDVHSLGGTDVVDQQAVGSPAYRLVRWLLAQPQVGQVGSPWDLDGAPSRSFTNDVHHDHVHISV